MSASLARTADGWWAVTPAGLVRLGLPAATTAALLADRAALHSAIEAAQQTAAAEPAEALPAESLDLLSPVTAPARVVAQAVNYRSHAIDSGFDPDTVPSAFFRKASHSITGPTGDIIRPDGVGFLDYEVELGLVIGTDLPVGTTVTDADLARYVAALVVANDVSARQVQLTKTQFYEAKSYPTFTPVGPWLTLVDGADLARLGSLRLTLSVNGQVRQDSTVADMIVRPTQALTLLSRFQPMAPGDLLLTGTPGGTALKAPGKIAEKLVGLLPATTKWKLFFRRQARDPRYLHDGDVITATIASPDGHLDLGTQHNTIAGRAKDLIIRGGHNIDPRVIEEALLAHPAVAAAAAVGRPDRHSGEVPVAYVVPAGPAAFDEAALLAWTDTTIAERAARPKRIYSVKAIPATAIGKHYKPALAADAAIRALTETLAAEGMAPAREVTATREDGRLVVTVAGTDPGRVLEAVGGFPLTVRCVP